MSVADDDIYHLSIGMRRDNVSFLSFLKKHTPKPIQLQIYTHKNAHTHAHTRTSEPLNSNIS